MNTTESRLITDKKEFNPLDTSLQTVTSNALPVPPNQNNSSIQVDKSLEQFYLDQQLDGKDLVKAREILGKRAETLTDEELKVTITEIKYLVESWLDTFEREIFKGLTLRELLHERG